MGHRLYSTSFRYSTVYIDKKSSASFLSPSFSKENKNPKVNQKARKSNANNSMQAAKDHAKTNNKTLKSKTHRKRIQLSSDSTDRNVILVRTLKANH